MNKSDKKLAIGGTTEYHALMRSIAVSAFRRKAGFIPPKMGEPLPPKNPINWQSKTYDVSAGVWWVFYACEQKLFSPTEIRKIWRYGQVLKKLPELVREYRRVYPQHDLLADWIEDTIKQEPLKYVDPFLGSFAFSYDRVRYDGIEVYGNMVLAQEVTPSAYAVGIVSYLSYWIVMDDHIDIWRDLNSYRQKITANAKQS